MAVLLLLIGTAHADTVTNDIPGLVAQLGAARHRDREQAEHQLWLRGEQARPALAEAAQSPDPEVRQRARAILEKLDLGLRPDMPVVVQELIRRFHECDSDDCRRIIVGDVLELPNVDRRAVLLQLAQRMPSLEQRMQVFSIVAEASVAEIFESFAANLPPPPDKLDALIDGLKLYLAVVPEDLNSPLSFVLWLRQHGEEKARTIAELAAQIHRERLQRDPNNAELHNNLAWLLAVSRFELDEAMNLAQRAVQLEPRQPAYIDTLAEVYFQKGDRAKALELIGRCLELEPESEYFRAQQERFREGDPNKPPPDPDLLVH